MVAVSINTSVNVEDGPQLSAIMDLDPDTYVFADSELGTTDPGDATVDIPLLPSSGNVVLLFLSAITGDDEPATIDVTLDPAATAPLTVTGSLLIANPSVLKQLVGTGERIVTVKNTEPVPTSVTVVAALNT